MSEASAPKRRWPQFNLRTIFLLVAVAAALCGSVLFGVRLFSEYAGSVQYSNSMGAVGAAH